MELLYIWIDNYKNIKQKGFNFSPKYRFDFVPTTFEKDEQGNETVTGGDLTHTENKNFPDNFFGEEISNVTAIVGENGSGKSSLLEAIMTKSNFNAFIIYDDMIPLHYKKSFLLIFNTKQIHTLDITNSRTPVKVFYSEAAKFIKSPLMRYIDTINHSFNTILEKIGFFNENLENYKMSIFIKEYENIKNILKNHLELPKYINIEITVGQYNKYNIFNVLGKMPYKSSDAMQKTIFAINIFRVPFLIAYSDNQTDKVNRGVIEDLFEKHNIFSIDIWEYIKQNNIRGLKEEFMSTYEKLLIASQGKMNIYTSKNIREAFEYFLTLPFVFLPSVFSIVSIDLNQLYFKRTGLPKSLKFKCQ